jgi:hypothetical protein
MEWRYCDNVTVMMYCGEDVVRLNYHGSIFFRGGTVRVYYGVEVL